MGKSIFKNVVFKLLLNIFNIIVPILIGPYVLRTLGPDLNGQINYSQAIFGYFFIFASFGVYQYGLREISKVREDKNKLESVFTSLFVLTVISNIIVSVVYIIFIYYQYSNTNIGSICIILTSNLLFNIFYVEWVNEALENFSFITIKTIIIRLIYVVALLIFVKTSNNLKEYLILLVLSTGLNNIVSYIYIRKRVKFNFSKLNIKKHIKPMILIVILSNANVLYTQIDKIFLGNYVSNESVAFYTMAQNITSIVNTMLLSIVYVSIPKLTNYLAEKKNDEYISLLDRVSRGYLMFLCPALMGMLLLAKQIVLIYAGSEYILATPIVVMFSLYTISIGYEVILSNQILYIYNKEKIQVRIVFLCGFINLLLKIAIIKVSVLTGVNAIVSTMFANILVVTMEYIYIKRNININYKLFSIDKSKYALISLSFIPINLIVTRFYSNIFIQIIIITFSCVGIYIFILLMIKDEYFMDVLNKIKSKFLIKKL